ncbi:hypothetical protein [Kitasatospora sp. MBT63]|uniref:hypothetical protein n=1 Tax=Kitasatospora sp. MBT63 TaxID=1444768 RepID=UPI00053B7BEA|nr:hypothetical protein [Kitasatospora sp. MBT63]
MTGELRLLQPDIRTDLLAALRTPDAAGTATTAASAATTASTVEIVLQMKGHEHEPEDLYCENLLGVLGQRAPYVLLRLLELEEELHQLRRVGTDPAQLVGDGTGGVAGAALPVETPAE